MSRRNPNGGRGSAYAPARADGAATLEFGGETLVYQPQSGEVHRLDPVGAIVWRVLDGQATIDELVADLAGAFEADPDVVHRDVEALLEKLRRGFLLADGPAPEPNPEPILLANPPSP